MINLHFPKVLYKILLYRSNSLGETGSDKSAKMKKTVQLTFSRYLLFLFFLSKSLYAHPFTIQNTPQKLTPPDGEGADGLF